MAAWQGKSSGTRLGYNIFVTLLQKGGLRPAYFLLYFVSAYYFCFAWRSSRHVWYYLRQRQKFSVFKSLKYLYKNYYAFGQSLIDRVAIMSGMGHKFSFNFDGESNIETLGQQKRGGLLLSAHVGNWEVAGHLLDRFTATMHIVMYDGEHQKIKDYLESVTGGRKASIIVVKENLSHIYAIHAALERGELVCIHADRFLPGTKTVEALFMDEKALFPSGPFILAAQFKVPVCFVFAMKEGATHYHFYGTAPKKYDFATDKKQAMDEMLKDYISQMEEKLRKYPEQWYNFYRFWNVEN